MQRTQLLKLLSCWAVLAAFPVIQLQASQCFSDGGGLYGCITNSGTNIIIDKGSMP